MPNHWELNERQKLIDTWLKGAVNLYGYMTPRAFLTLFNKHNTTKLLKAELLKYSNKLDKKSWMYYCIFENAIVNTTVPDKYIQETYYRQQGKKYYLPTKEDYSAALMRTSMSRHQKRKVFTSICVKS